MATDLTSGTAEEREVLGLRSFAAEIGGEARGDTGKNTEIFRFSVPPGLERAAETLAAERVAALKEQVRLKSVALLKLETVRSRLNA